MLKSAEFIKMLILLSALAFSAAVDASEPNPPTPPAPSDYSVSATDLYTRLDVVNEQIAKQIYNSMRLPETELVGENNVTTKFKKFFSITSDLFFFCGVIESTSFSCYFQIQKIPPSNRLFESPSTTSLKLTALSDSKKWTEALPAKGEPNSPIISALIIENFLETYCEKSSLSDEEICHITIYKKNQKSRGN